MLIAVVIRVTRRPLICIGRPVERRGAVVVSAPPPCHPRPRATEVHFFVDQRFGRLKLGTLLKDHSDQHCWSNSSEQCEFFALLLFLLAFSKTVNYIHKLVLGPKESVLKFNGLGDIPFLSVFSHYTAFKTQKLHSQTP